MNYLDRVVSYFDPVEGLRREAARRTLDQVRSYDGAKIGRRTEGWRASASSANGAIKGALPRLRHRSRDVVRNTWWGARIADVFVAHAVGTGVMPVVKTGNKTANRKAAAAFRQWGRSCDAEGQLDVNGLMALAVRTLFESGEVLTRKVPTRLTPGRVPLEIQLLEPDHLDSSRDGFRDGAIVDQGIEYGLDGKRRAFWLLPEHPGATSIAGRSAAKRIDAREILHVYRKQRIGQGRGVPAVAPILIKGRDVADLEEAITVKAKIEACLSVFVKSSDPARNLGSAAAGASERGESGKPRRLESVSPGMIAYLGQDEEITAVTPSSSFAFEGVLINAWMTLAAGAGFTYDQVTGDLRQANYSSLRAGKIEFRRLIEQFQWLTLVPMFLDPLWEAFVQAAMDAGVLERRRGGYPVEWIMPAVEPIDPLKDLQADILAVRSGRMTWPQFVAGWGFEPDAQIEEIEKWQKDLDDRGVALDCDPRRAAKGVKYAANNETGGTDPPKPKDDEDE